MANFDLMCKQLAAVIKDVEYDISNLANASALIWDSMDRLNWAGFYVMRDGHLALGPFQGKLACTKIEIGKGVCGTAVAEDSTIVVENVHEFPGHIACDSASNSEIVVPIHRYGEIYGVLDIDSPEIGRFGEAEREGLEKLVRVIEENWYEMQEE